MPSVCVTWRGASSSIEKQLELLWFLERLAHRSERRCKEALPARPAFLQVMIDQTKKEVPEIPLIRRFDQEIEGRIIVAPHLAADETHVLAEARRLGIAMVPPSTPGNGCLLVLERIRVRGVDFELFDPRTLYPEENRISFVFLASEALPALDGCIAQVAGREFCTLYGNPAVNSADWYLSSPSIHLRYYLEEWTDLFLAWVKYFFVPDLYYWRWEKLPRYEQIRSAYEKDCVAAGVEVLKGAWFEYLLEQFEREADEWIAKMITWST